MQRKLDQLLSYCFIPLTALITLLSILILCVSTPPIWTAIYRNAMPENMHKIYKEDAKKISDGFWQKKSYIEINKDLTATKYKIRTLGRKEIAHFEDVKKLVHFFFYPSCIGILILLLWWLLFKKRIHWHLSFAYLILIGGTLTIWGAVAWRHMFRTLHWWIFQDDSWILPKKCYTLMLFPYAAWQMVSIIVMSTLAGLLLLLTIPQVVRFISIKKKL